VFEGAVGDRSDDTGSSSKRDLAADEHRNRCISDQGVGSGAEQRGTVRTVAVCPHGDEIGAGIDGKLRYRFSGPADANLHARDVRTEPASELAQLPFPLGTRIDLERF
jgi:hypothetical protein